MLKTDSAMQKLYKHPPKREGSGRPTWRTEVVDVEYKLMLEAWGYDPDYATEPMLEVLFHEEKAEGFNIEELRRCLRYERDTRSKSSNNVIRDARCLCTPAEKQAVEIAIKRHGAKYKLPGWEELDAPLLD